MMSIVLCVLSIGAITQSALEVQPPARDLVAKNGSVYASMRLFEHENFLGIVARMPIYKPNTCYTISCFDDRAKSATWKAPKHTILGFFEDKKCKAGARWFGIHDNYTHAANLESPKGVLVNHVSAVMVLKIGAGPMKYVQGCPTGTQVVNELYSGGA